MKKYICLLFCWVFLSGLIACVQTPGPDQVVSAYFAAAAEGDIFALRPFLTPDGQEIINQLESDPVQKENLIRQKETQKQFWTGIRSSVSAPQIRGNRAEVLFTATVPDRGAASCLIVLFKIDGEWKISSTSISGVQAERFQNDLVTLKVPAAVESQHLQKP